MLTHTRTHARARARTHTHTHTHTYTHTMNSAENKELYFQNTASNNHDAQSQSRRRHVFFSVSFVLILFHLRASSRSVPVCLRQHVCFQLIFGIKGGSGLQTDSFRFITQRSWLPPAWAACQTNIVQRLAPGSRSQLILLRLLFYFRALIYLITLFHFLFLFIFFSFFLIFFILFFLFSLLYILGVGWGVGWDYCTKEKRQRETERGGGCPGAGGVVGGGGRGGSQSNFWRRVNNPTQKQRRLTERRDRVGEIRGLGGGTGTQTQTKDINGGVRVTVLCFSSVHS